MSSRRDFVGLAAATALLPSMAQQSPPPGEPEQPMAGPDWLDQWRTAHAALGSRTVYGQLVLARFKDPTYVLQGQSIAWAPSEADTSLPRKVVSVPLGFVTDLASIPRAFYSLLRPDGEYAFAAIIHDYLYWAQVTRKDVADDIFRSAMRDFGVPTWKIGLIFAGVRTPFGDQAWKVNGDARRAGERRILKTLPQDPTVTWGEWKQRTDVWADVQV